MDYEVIAERRNPLLAEKAEIVSLIDNSYRGGEKYRSAGYLYRYGKESENSFNKRKERATYFNQLASIVNMAIGFLFASPPVREGAEAFNYLIDDATGTGKTVNAFMQIVARQSLMYTSGVLVDSPHFDNSEILTERDRVDNDVNPYCIFYPQSKIRDFAIVKGVVQWVLLDNSYYNNDNPFEEGEDKKTYRLWTREYIQDFDISYEQRVKEIIASKQMPNPLREVPFRFVSWQDDDSDYVQDSFCEDIALISKAIYNNMSYMDEMLAAGTFKMLTYPSVNGKVPPELAAGGMGSLSILPYEVGASTPAFIGAELGDMTPFISAIQFYMTEILKKMGLDTDEIKQFVKSGVSKKLDFEKIKSLLIAGARQMEDTERWIFETAGKWENKSAENINISYTRNFLTDDIDAELLRFSNLLILPGEQLQRVVQKIIVKKTLSDEVSTQELNELIDEIDAEEIEENITETESDDVPEIIEEEESDE